MKNLLEKHLPFWAALGLGMSSTSCVWIVNGYSYPHASEQEAMRSDWITVGTTIGSAMEKGDVKAIS